MAKKHDLYVERRPQGDCAVGRPGSERASAVAPTQAQAIVQARKLDALAAIHTEPVRETTVRGRDQWRKP